DWSSDVCSSDLSRGTELDQQRTDGIHVSARAADEGLAVPKVGGHLGEGPGSDASASARPRLDRRIAGAQDLDPDPRHLGQLLEFGAEDDVRGAGGAVDEDDIGGLAA